MSKKFWKGKNVLITGYEGFIGSWLTKRLISYGASILGLDILTHRKETILTTEELKTINVVKGSVENYSLVNGIIKENRIEFVFHLAAKALVGECLKNPLKAFSTNIRGNWNILEACRKNNTVKAIIVASSDKAYGEQRKLPYTEDMALCGNHPYDVSKSCADLLALAYSHTYGLPVCVTRCGNIYGPGDFNFSRIVPDAMRSVLLDRTLFIRSDGKFTRDYIYVEDIIDGYILLAQKLQELKLRGEAFNFSDENPMAVIELVKKIYEICGEGENYRILNAVEHEIKHQYLSFEKARKLLGWKPRFTLDEGLERTIEWYSAFLHK